MTVSWPTSSTPSQLSTGAAGYLVSEHHARAPASPSSSASVMSTPTRRSKVSCVRDCRDRRDAGGVVHRAVRLHAHRRTRSTGTAPRMAATITTSQARTRWATDQTGDRECRSPPEHASAIRTIPAAHTREESAATWSPCAPRARDRDRRRRETASMFTPRRRSSGARARHAGPAIGRLTRNPRIPAVSTARAEPEWPPNERAPPRQRAAATPPQPPGYRSARPRRCTRTAAPLTR